MLQNIQNKTILAVITLLLMSATIFAQDSATIFAQDEEDPGGIGGDPGVAAINDWIPIMLFIGIAIVFFYTHKRKKSITN